MRFARFLCCVQPSRVRRRQPRRLSIDASFIRAPQPTLRRRPELAQRSCGTRVQTEVAGRHQQRRLLMNELFLRVPPLPRQGAQLIQTRDGARGAILAQTGLAWRHQQ